jgi:hypothetical protein
MHEVVDAREEQPLPAAHPPDERVLERARLGLVALDRLRRALDDALAVPDAAAELFPAGPGLARDARHDRGRLGGEPTGCRQCPGQREPGPRVGGMANRLGDVPVALPAGQVECVVGKSSNDLVQRRSHRGQLGRDGRGAPGVGPAPDLTPNREEPAFLDVSIRAHDVGRARFKVVEPAHVACPAVAACASASSSSIGGTERARRTCQATVTAAMDPPSRPSARSPSVSA